MRIFRWIIEYVKSLFGFKEKLPEVPATKEPDISEPTQTPPKSSKKVDYISKRVDELPEEDDIESNTVYIVGENGFHWLAAFKCPCGCAELIQLNLLKEAKPSWKVSHNRQGNISITPSIDRKVGCKSHFTLRNGDIDWWDRREN